MKRSFGSFVIQSRCCTALLALATLVLGFGVFAFLIPQQVQEIPHSQHFSVLVLGAGPTGLGAAWRLSELLPNTLPFAVFEATNDAGGLSSSVEHENFVWDFGGHVLFSHFAAFDRIIASLYAPEDCPGSSCLHERRAFAGIPSINTENNLTSFVTVRYPVQLHAAADFAASEPVTAARIQAEIVTCNSTANPASFKEWLLGSFGQTLCKRFLFPYNEKQWAHPLGALDIVWVGERVAPPYPRRPSQQQIKENWGPNSRFFYPPQGGIGDIWKRLALAVNNEMPGTIQFGMRAVEIDVKRRVVTLEKKETAERFKVTYQTLISTLPLHEFARIVRSDSLSSTLRNSLSRAATQLKFSTVHVVGVGVCGCEEPAIARNTSWFYFPHSRSQVRFFRLTVLSHYSKKMAPVGCYSLMTETSESVVDPLSYDHRKTLVSDVVEQLRELGFIASTSCNIQTTFYTNRTYSYPIPTLGRDALLRELQHDLESVGVFSRGRFGSFKYEVGNMDHSFVQGLEIANRVAATLRHIRTSTQELVLNNPTMVNSRHWNSSFPETPLPILRDMYRPAAIVASQLAQSITTADLADDSRLRVRRHVVLAHFNEDLSWISQLPPWITMSIYTHNENISGARVQLVKPNHGREAHLYVRWILDNYYHLPERILFLHAHKKAWHIVDSVRSVRCMDWNSTHGYLAVSDYNRFSRFIPWGKRTEGPSELAKTMAQLFVPLFGELPKELQLWCCAQFLVHRDRILARPRGIWQWVLEFTEDPTIYTYTAGLAMEYFWPSLMGQPFIQQKIDAYVAC